MRRPPCATPRAGPPATAARVPAPDSAGRLIPMIPKTLYLVAGARPNFMKLAPMVRALAARPDAFRVRIVHTGQHYDREMSDVFFHELGIPRPDHHLGAGGGSHAQQTARVMEAFERLCVESRPDAVLVVGDVNSTLACSIVAKKLCIPVAHVEAGLRSGDMTMPEEINRLVTDAISDWFFVTEPSGEANLLREGKPRSAVHHVGHVMVDNVLFQRDALERAPLAAGASLAFKAAQRALRRGHAAPAGDGRRRRRVRPRRARAARRVGTACRWCSRCIRARAPTWSASASTSAPASSCCRRWATWSSSTCGRTPPSCSPTAAACRRKPPRSACRA